MSLVVARRTSCVAILARNCRPTDKPYDAFVREQIAGDLLAADLIQGLEPRQLIPLASQYAESATAIALLQRERAALVANQPRADVAYGVAEGDPVHVHDFHATILHLLGFDHTRLTHRHAGRDFRLTDMQGNVVRNVLA